MSSPKGRMAPALRWSAVLLVALSLSIGWGVRGNWGHEYGAMIPGALAAMAAALVSGREDWRRRIAYFAFFGALGWSFGGSISYMQVIAYTHSGHWATVPYGFAALFLIGFLWAAVGGAGTALPALVDRDRLTEFFVPLACVFAAWAGEDLFFALAGAGQQEGASRLTSWAAAQAAYLAERPIGQFDTDWLAVLLAIAATLALAVVRRRICRASSLILHLAVGWWLGFTILTLACGLRMTPPRGDSWAGSVGLVAGMFVYLLRQRMTGVALTALVAGLWGGLGFSGGVLLQHLEISSGLNTNWHSILEQTYGFINGLGIAVGLGYLSTRAEPLSDEPPTRRWTEPFCVAFVMLLVTWVNIRKNPEAIWLPSQVVPELMYGVSIDAWLGIAYALLAGSFLVLLLRHYRGRRIALVPTDWLGKGQLMYLIFLWWIVMGNLSRVLPFSPERLVTEGAVHLNACLCTLLVLLVPSSLRAATVRSTSDYARALKRVAVIGLSAAVAIILLEAVTVRAIWGDRHSGYGGHHIRFGPHATLDKK